MLSSSLLVLALSAQVFAQQTVIKADGSSTVFPITEAMAEEFQAAKGGAVKVTVGISGTGGGFKKFCRGETDIQDASRPISKDELETCRKANIKFIELPIAYDAIVVAVNPKNKLSEIDIATLKKMWEPSAQGTVMTWDAANAAYPKEKLSLYGAGADSGTFDYFTEAVVGKAKSSRGDYTASEDDNTLVMGISNDKNAIGYLPLAYFEGNKKKLKALSIVGAPGAKAVAPTNKTVADGSYSPLSRPIFIYVNVDSLKRSEVKEFVQFYLKSSEKIVPEVKYIALPKAAYKIGLEHIEKSKTGSVFSGHSAVGMKIDELMKKEGVL